MPACTDPISQITLVGRPEDRVISVERGVKEEIGSYGDLERVAGYGKFRYDFEW